MKGLPKSLQLEQLEPIVRDTATAWFGAKVGPRKGDSEYALPLASLAEYALSWIEIAPVFRRVTVTLVPEEKEFPSKERCSWLADCPITHVNWLPVAVTSVMP